MIKTRPLSTAGWMLILAFLDSGSRAVWAENAPPLLLLGAAFCALRNGTPFGLLMGAGAGLWMEVFGIGRMGGFLFLAGLVSAVSGPISSRLFTDSPIIRLALPLLVYVIQTAGQVFSWQTFLWTTLIAQFFFPFARFHAQPR